MRRILFVSPRQCWPATSGAKLRDYHLARALGACSELTYIYYADPGVPALTTQDLPFCRAVISVPKPKAYSGARLIRGLTSPWPLTVINYHSPEMASALEDLLASRSFEIIHLDATQLAAFQPMLQTRAPHAQIVFDWHNIESELLRRYAGTASSLVKRVYAQATEKRMAALELNLLHSRAAHIVCSRREETVLRGIAPLSRVAVIENGVDAAAFAAPGDGARRRILFVGLMAYHANVDAAVWFTREVWPQVRQRFPGFTLTLVGANPATAVLELRSEPGVEVTGTVPDVRPFYGEAFAVVVPLRTGAGTRLKILEAMASGVPVTSTALGAEGLAATAGIDLLIAEQPEEWLIALEAVRDAGRRGVLTANARKLVESRYDWNIIGQTLLDTYEGWLAT